jgi:transposase
MKEEFLHYLWKYGLYNSEKLSDPGGNKITVIHPGDYNRDAGPDFFNARILIEDTLWAGNVELHIRASHYNSHGHNSDPAYDNVILHVVAENDKKVFNTRGEEVLTVALDYDPGLYSRYVSLVNNPCIIACQDYIGRADMILLRQWLGRLVAERLEEKSAFILKIYAETANDWEETFYRVLSRYFGFRVNREPFEMLAAALPFRIIRRHADNLFQIEALLFGVAGMLEEGLFREALNDSYYRDLIREFSVLSSKYSLKPLHGWIWKFSRLRPVNFPTVRISQLAAMLSVAGGLFSKVTEADDLTQLRDVFQVSSSSYWHDHYVFGKRSRRVNKKTGSQAACILLVNAVIPVIFVYGKSRGISNLCERALDFLDQLEPEENSIINEWKKTGIYADSALYSQALIQLRNSYCRKRRCLECSVGNNLILSDRCLKENDELLLEP